MAVTKRFIVGPPGSGKTTRAKAYVEQITDYDRPNRVSPNAVALVSFTNAAAATLAGRGIPVPRQNIGTLHSFAFRALGLNKEQVAESKIDDFNNSQSVYKLASKLNRFRRRSMMRQATEPAGDDGSTPTNS
jgi:superfamily I DNA/RNA helicase